FPHTGRWAKKIKGELHFFGHWARREGGKFVPVEGDGWEEAKKEYDCVIDDLLAGCKPRPKESDGADDALDMHREGVGFHTLRHVFEAIAGATKDQVAVDFIMGRTDQSMANAYREKIDDTRLRLW